MVLCGGCASNQMEQNFFDKEYDQAGTRFEEYSIPNQIKIYFYGMQSIRPQVTVLSRPIAEHGAKAVPYLLSALSANPTDENIQDALVIFETMQRLATYSVQHDKSLMQKLDAYVSKINGSVKRGQSKSQLAQIRNFSIDENP